MVYGPGLGKFELELGLGYEEDWVEAGLALDKLVKVSLEHLQLEAEDSHGVDAVVVEQAGVDTMMAVMSVRGWRYLFSQATSIYITSASSMAATNLPAPPCTGVVFFASPNLPSSPSRNKIHVYGGVNRGNGIHL